MPSPSLPSTTPSAHRRVMLDARHLKALCQRRDTTVALSERFEARRQALARAALLRTEAGKPVADATVRRLAAFYGIAADTLVDAAPAAARPGPCDERPGLERLQCRALLDAVRGTGCGRLVDVLGAAGAGKSALLDACAADARAAGYACAVLRLAAHDDDAHDGVDALLLALLGLDGAAMPGPAQLGARVRERCWILGLPAAHIDACLSLLEGRRRWPLPAVHLLQTAALCALVQHCARAQPLFIAIDGMHDSGWQLAMMLNVLVPATLEFPVLWLLAGEPRPATPHVAQGARLAALARSTFHLAAPPVRRGRADVASVLRICRSAPRVAGAAG